MKKAIILLSIGAVMTTTSAIAKNKKESKTSVVVNPMSNKLDSMSYALGLNVGADFAQSMKKIPGGKSNVDLVIKGFVTAMKGDSALMSKEMATNTLRTYIMEEQKKETEAKKIVGEKFLAENKTKEGVNTTESGLQYLVIVPASGPKPSATDSVKVHYTGTLIDGTKFDSSVDRGQPITFPLNQVIPGWTEGVQLMSVGAKYKFFIPYNLGYGVQGAGEAIPPYSTLIFEVELLSFTPAKPVVTPVVEEQVKTEPEAPKSKKITKGKK
jgi:FKBP-type peptidyl-prolyl cis-trans isomerase